MFKVGESVTAFFESVFCSYQDMFLEYVLIVLLIEYRYYLREKECTTLLYRQALQRYSVTLSTVSAVVLNFRHRQFCLDYLECSRWSSSRF